MSDSIIKLTSEIINLELTKKEIEKQLKELKASLIKHQTKNGIIINHTWDHKNADLILNTSQRYDSLLLVSFTASQIKALLNFVTVSRKNALDASKENNINLDIWSVEDAKTVPVIRVKAKTTA
jgi:hypothetical protein